MGRKVLFRITMEVSGLDGGQRVRHNRVGQLPEGSLVAFATEFTYRTISNCIGWKQPATGEGKTAKGAPAKVLGFKSKQKFSF